MAQTNGTCLVLLKTTGSWHTYSSNELWTRLILKENVTALYENQSTGQGIPSCILRNSGLSAVRCTTEAPGSTLWNEFKFSR